MHRRRCGRSRQRQATALSHWACLQTGPGPPEQSADPATLLACRKVCLLKVARNVLADRLRGQRQACTDLRVREPSRSELEHFPLTSRQTTAGEAFALTLERGLRRDAHRRCSIPRSGQRTAPRSSRTALPGCSRPISRPRCSGNRPARGCRRSWSAYAQQFPSFEPSARCPRLSHRVCPINGESGRVPG